MIIVLKKSTSEDDIEDIVERIRRMGCDCRISYQNGKSFLVTLCNRANIDLEGIFARNEHVEALVPITKPYKLASRQGHPESTIIDVSSVPVGGETFAVMAGPCSVEDEAGLLEAAHGIKRYGGHILRGGAFKPRTSPYSFQGLGNEGLEFLSRARESTGLPVVTELLSEEHLDAVTSCADIVQIGTRNAQNTALLCKVASSGKPVLLKRGMASTIEEWLMAAEYLLSHGNSNVILCERGIRSFETMTRNTLDLSAVAIAKRETHLPVVVDPSHATGMRDLIIPMARAAAATGADGLMVEVHPNPEKALSDGSQSLTIEQFGQLMREIEPIVRVMGKKLEVENTSPAGVGAGT